MVKTLNSMNCGICINNVSYNVFTYADDLLLSSTTVTGLQRLINCAVSYISNHGIRFNPDKTKCMIFGNNPFTDNPKWNIEGIISWC